MNKYLILIYEKINYFIFIGVISIITNEKRYLSIVIEETFYIPTLGDDGKIRSIPKVYKSYLPPTHAYVLNGLIPVNTKGDTKIRYEPADKETRLAHKRNWFIYNTARDN